MDETTLMLVGNPTDFAVEAAEQLVEYYQLGQRGMEVPRLTGALSALNDESAFLRHLELLADGLGVDLAAPPIELCNETSTQGTSTDGSADGRPATHETPQGQETTPDDEHDSEAAAPSECPEPSEGDPQPGKRIARRPSSRPPAAVPAPEVSTTKRIREDAARALTRTPPGNAIAPASRRAVAPPITSGCSYCRAVAMRAQAMRLRGRQAAETTTPPDRRCFTTRSTAVGVPRKWTPSSPVSTSGASTLQAASGASR